MPPEPLRPRPWSAAHWIAIALGAFGALFLYVAFNTHVVDTGFVVALFYEMLGGALVAAAVIVELVWLIVKLAKRRA
ncbi:MAG TPA: hypothetical protein VFF06_31845 [Polyangia bacterium]|nr:hypothetical protein [Polyangia bacterium]